MKFDEVFAHCDIPCKIYDPIVIQVAALSVVRILDIINETSHEDENSNISEISRLTAEKEKQASIVKDEVRIIWGDYFKEPQIKSFPQIHDLVHQIMLQGSKCKQGIDRKNGEILVDLVNEFSEIFWATKDIKTKSVKAPYPPSLNMIYPDLDNV